MSSSVDIDTIAYLRNPRQVGTTPSGNPSKVWMFDVEMYIGIDAEGQEQGMAACLRFFNQPDLQFGQVGLYAVRALIGSMPERNNIDLGSNARPRDHYIVAGDIQRLIPLHEVQIEEVEGKEVTSIKLPNLDTRILPYLTICGVALNSNKEKATFDIDARQYALFANGYIDFPKPTPNPDRYVQITGYLTGIEGGRFTMDVNNVTFLGYAPKAAAPPAPILPLTPAPSSSKTGAEWGTPSWARNIKRKLNDGSGSKAPSSSPT
ncbi:hypothetical protein C8R47DRAFT_1222738 [Mycena vitilis]|nr:hypothetical protein C8R47DRAFT_1222738 [Mycena vitilis]